jgi:uncharacterized protein (UPF0261 family)
MFDALQSNLKREIPYVELDANINDRQFAEKATSMMLDLIAQSNA